MLTESTTKFFPCECGAEGLTVVHPECDWDGKCRTNGDPRIVFSFWALGHGDQRWSWKLRLRCIWWIIRKGKPFDDMVCMRSEVARSLAHHILDLVDGKVKKADHKSFKDFLEQTSKIVAQWPKWKQEVLGRIDGLDQST